MVRRSHFQAVRFPRRRTATAAALAVATAVTVAACGSTPTTAASSPASTTSVTSAAGTTATTGSALTIGTSADFPPLSSKSSSGTIVGFENDMLNSVIPQTGHSFSWTQLDFNGLIPALQSGRLDAVVSGVYDTAARAKIVSFVDYMQIPLAVLTLKSNAAKVTGPMALCGHVVADLVGSPPETSQIQQWSSQCTAAGHKAITEHSYQTVSQAVTDVTNGRAYGELEGDIVVLYVSKTKFGNKLTSAFEVQGGTSKVGIAVQKNSPLLPALRSAVKSFVASPAYCSDATKWGLTPGDLLRSCS